MMVTLVLCACGNDQFSSSHTDGGDVGPGGGGDAGDSGVEAGALTPAHAPASVAFVDQDPTALKVQGTVKISKATDESDVTGYVLYWSSDGTTKLGAAITTVAKTGGDLVYPFDANTAAPANANSLLAFTTNDRGENPSPASSAGDNFARFNSTAALSAFPVASGTFVPIFFEDSVKKFGLLSLADTFLCPASSGACTQTPTGLPTTGAPVILASTVDSASGKIIGFSGSTAGSSLAICNADGTGCANTALDASLTNPASAALLVDDVGGKLYVVVRSGVSTITVCNHDGTGCALHQFTDNGGPSDNYGSYSLAIDSASSRLVIAAQTFTNSNEPAVILCPLAFGATDTCVAKVVDPSATADSGHQPSVVVDKGRAKILVVTEYASGSADTPSLFSCDLSGSGCSRTDLSSAMGLPTGSGQFPSAAIDQVGEYLYVGVYTSDTDVPSLLRCRTDGTACTATQILPSASTHGGPMSIRLDATSGKIFFAYPTSTTPVFGSISVW
ncbi:MAG: hypothetical protein ABI183_04985 [Polyangiaceae bacterium]